MASIKLRSIIPQSLPSYSSSHAGQLSAARNFHRSCVNLAPPGSPSSSSSSTTPTSFKIERKAEWKRRQGGQMFLDHLIVNIRGGKGGDGAVAFHREKFKPNGPPSGGNGGHGGSVYIRCVNNQNSLAGITKRIRAAQGGNGLGTWRHGKRAPDCIISVPVGTIVREVLDHRRGKDEFEAEQEALENLDEEEKIKKLRDMRWVHYPTYAETNVESEFFKHAEEALIKEEKAAERTRLREKSAKEHDPDHNGIYIDFASPTPSSDQKGVLVASGGTGGFGNPHFLSLENRSPKFATRGQPGERITLEFELKLLADIGLVGLPNAGKSTVLRALTRSKAEVAPYAFTTLNPQVGTVRVWEGGGFGDWKGLKDQASGRGVIQDSHIERQLEEQEAQLGTAPNPHHHSSPRRELPGEAMRFTIADNPGLIAKASENVGLGHSFLRSIERSLALVYVVDFSSDSPWDDLKTLKQELEAYKPGLSRQARMVLANKADLLAPSNSQEEIDQAREKLMKLEAAVKLMEEEQPHLAEDETGTDPPIDVIPISGKYQVNLEAAVARMMEYVKDAREKAEATR